MKTVIEMARQVEAEGFAFPLVMPEVRRLCELVTEQANARANASWSLMCKKMVADEREACAKVCESRQTPGTGSVAILNGAADAIRARGNT